MPATSEKQRRFMGAELARKRAGKKTRTGMSEGQLKEYAMKVKSKMPTGAPGKNESWGDVSDLRMKELAKIFPNRPSGSPTRVASKLPSRKMQLPA